MENRTTPVLAYDYSKGTQGLEGAGFIVFNEGQKQGQVIAGVEVDLAVDREGRTRTAKIVHVGEGVLQLPPTSSENVQIELPAPVSLPTGGWGILWVEADTGYSYKNSPSGIFLRRLWFSEYKSPDWLPPRLLLTSNFGMRWEEDHTIRYSPEGDLMIMVVATTGPNLRQEAMFSNALSEMQPLPIPEQLTVDAATFAIDTDGTIISTVVVRPVRSSDVNHHQVMLLSSSDGGEIWSKPQVIMDAPRSVSRMNLQYDQERNLHLIWEVGLSNLIQHSFKPFESEEWLEQQFDLPAGYILRWRVGVDRCGRFTFMREAGLARTELTIDKSHWRQENGWSSFEIAYPEFYNMYLFDGTTRDGKWVIGWTGDRLPSDESDYVMDMKAWIVEP